MKKILEYKVYDLLKDKDNEKFLDKVKKENPDLYANFLTILGNKGLEVAKQKYQEYDPEYIEFLKKKEKERQLELKRLRTKEGKIESRNKILDKYSDEITEYEKVLEKSYLKILEKNIKNNKILNDYIDSYKAKKSYKNILKQELKTPEKIFRYFGYDLKIDSLIYERNTFSWEYEGYKKRELIHIIQYYNIIDKTFKYQINFNLPLTWWDLDYVLPKIDANKDEKFVDARNSTINNFKKSDLNRTELETIIMKVTYLLSDDCYEKWKLQQDTNKYNL